jgi:RNA-directed DNA polymerase
VFLFVFINRCCYYRNICRSETDAVRAKTERTNGQCLEAIIAEIDRTTMGGFEYFKHRIANTFPRLDSWIRMRLRSLLRKRAGATGAGLAPPYVWITING